MKKLFALATILALACLALPALAEEADLPVVYMTTDISPEGLMAVYEALGREAAGENVAVKISTGETDSNYLRPELIGEFVQAVDGTIVECNTAYGGQRASTAMHYQLAEDHSYTAIADVDIMDENGSMTLPVEGGTVIAENYVGANLANYDFLVVLSHFKGHAMAGFGGALKNLSIGCASSDGKAWIHSGGTGGNMWGGEQDAFLEAMAEAAKSVVNYFGNGERALYINVMNPPFGGLRLRRQPRRAGYARHRHPRLHRPGGAGSGVYRPCVRGGGWRLADPAHRVPQRPAYAGTRRGDRLWQPRICTGQHRRVGCYATKEAPAVPGMGTYKMPRKTWHREWDTVPETFAKFTTPKKFTNQKRHPLSKEVSFSSPEPDSISIGVKLV